MRVQQHPFSYFSVFPFSSFLFNDFPGLILDPEEAKWVTSADSNSFLSCFLVVSSILVI